VIWLVLFRFRKIQWQTKAVYNAVLRVKNEATKMLVPGTLWKQYHIEVGKLMTSELLGLGLLDKTCKTKTRQACLQIFHARNIAPHGTRHLITESWLNLCKPIWFHSRTRFTHWRFRNSPGRRPRDSRKRRTIQPNAQHSIEADEIESLMN
jgi:Xaa-Pro aminopeptidase